jgi:hypothetical protein
MQTNHSKRKEKNLNRQFRQKENLLLKINEKISTTIVIREL